MAAGAVFQWAYNGPGAEATLALGGNTLNLPATNGSQGNPVFRPDFTTVPSLGTYVMTWTAPPANTPAWTFDTSLEGAGNFAVWGYNGNGSWDTGTKWAYAVLTAGSLSYTSSGLQVSALSSPTSRARRRPARARS